MICSFFINLSHASLMLKFTSFDEGGEFNDGSLARYLVNLGIHHQFACPKTLEQNSIVQHMHQHITELGLTMMLHACLPSRFWVKCLCIATFLINSAFTPSWHGFTFLPPLWETFGLLNISGVRL